MSKSNRIKVIITIIVLAIIAVLAYMRWYSSEQWGVGDLRAAERSYCINRISGIVETWLASRKDANNYIEGGGRMKESYVTLLVIDTAENAIWIEDGGQVRQGCRGELPAKMGWTFYRSTPDGCTELPGRTRLKIRGYYAGYHDGEQFHLVGTGRGWAQIDYYFNAVSKNSYGSYSQPFVRRPYHAGYKRTEKSYPSLVLTESEYRQHLASLPAADPNHLVAQSRLDRNRVSFRKVEKLLYQQIGKRVADEGFAVRHISITPGPDYTAAQANVGIIRSGLLHTYLRGRYCGAAYVQIDHLGNDTWYASTCVHPRSPSRNTPPDFNLEFLARPTEKLPRSQRKSLMKKGREIQGPAATASKYVVALSGGVTVEFLGLCEHPDVGGKWWGPDGAALECAAYLAPEVHDLVDEDTKLYNIAWRIRGPKSVRASVTDIHLEGARSSYSGTILDRYGNKMTRDFRAETRAFEKSRKATTLEVAIKLADAQSHRVKFENISLIANQDPGFKIQLRN